MLPAGESIRLLARRDDAELQAWWLQSPFMHRMEIVDSPIPCRSPRVGVALIADSAYSHATSIETALDAGFHVASEKPLGFSLHQTLRLQAKAEAAGLRLFATNTYLFADYLRVFSRDWLKAHRYTDIELIWSDAVAEIRYGIRKSYDSGVPIIHDLLPHIACLVLATHGAIAPKDSKLVVRRGGSEATAQFDCGEVRVSAILSRNGRVRARVARFSGDEGELSIDFSTEPGVVTRGRGEPQPSDLSWPSKRKPLAEMLHGLQVYFSTGLLDERLDLRAARLGNELIDSVVDSYVRQQIAFLGHPGENGSRERGAEFAYAAKESRSIAQRVLPHLPPDSPLRRLAVDLPAH